MDAGADCSRRLQAGVPGTCALLLRALQHNPARLIQCLDAKGAVEACRPGAYISGSSVRKSASCADYPLPRL
jgi:hypothetical protein